MAESDRYTAVARRYRPQQFADLIGQEHVADALANAIRSGRVAHAYLFTGGRGMGKTTTARILAKALNCVHGPTPTPCDACDSCTAIMSGQDVDVVEIDAASNTGVDNIRDLKANVGFRPQHGRFKIYIVDEAHMLSNAAFNALLKTLEEPPPHVKFMLATTDVQKLPATILSRCQRFDFAAITPAKVQATLAHIAKREGIDADPEALAMLSRRAQGSMRDAQTLLDQLLGAVEGKLTPGDVERVLGLAAGDRLGRIADALVAGDARAALAGLTDAISTGVQAPELIDQLVEHWRGLMLAHVAGPESATDAHRAHAKLVSLDAVLAGIDLLVGAKTKLRSGVSAEVVAEVAVVRLARLADLVSVAQLVRQLQGVPDRPLAATAPPSASAPVSGPGEEKKKRAARSAPGATAVRPPEDPAAGD